MNVTECLVAHGFTGPVCTHVLQQLEGAEGMNLIIKDLASPSSVVIRDSDFKWFDEAVKAGAGLAAAGTLSAWAPAAIATLILLLYSFRKKGMDVDAVDAALLRCLKARSRSASELAEAVPNQSLDAAAVEERLEVLKERTSAAAAIVLKGADGRWSAVGI